jgi:hypothetical protein
MEGRCKEKELNGSHRFGNELVINTMAEVDGKEGCLDGPYNPLNFTQNIIGNTQNLLLLPNHLNFDVILDQPSTAPTLTLLPFSKTVNQSDDEDYIEPRYRRQKEKKKK